MKNNVTDQKKNNVINKKSNIEIFSIVNKNNVIKKRVT